MNVLRPPPQTSDQVDRDSDGAAALIPAYKAWKGSNVFLFHGRFIFGPDVRSVFLTLFLIVAPVAVFCAFVGRKLMDEFSHHLGILIMVVVVVFTLYDVVLLLWTSGRDPGIIPRNAHPPEPENINDSTETGQTPQLRLPRIKDVVVNGITVKIKYCDTCMLYRPPRCSHCSICNNCVERFDHHCPWVGQCIGKRNYRFFFMFVSSTTILCLYVFAFCWVYIVRMKNSEHISIWKAMSKTPASIALVVYTFVAVWFVGGLTVFHLYLIGTNQSTYENFRYRYDRRDNPYNRGLIQNFAEVFFNKIPLSKNNFRALVPNEPEIPPRMVGSAFINRNSNKSAAEIRRSKLAYDDSSANEGDYSNDESVDLTSPQPDIRMHHHHTEDVELRNAYYQRQTSLERRSGNLNASPEVVSMASQIEDLNRTVNAR